MSLQHVDGGATCSECGHFDFLPVTCIRCRAVLCGAHLDRHFVPSTRRRCEAEAKGEREGEAKGEAEAPPAPPAPPAAPSHRCALCGSGLCALTPCPACRRDFCAAHRFHSHGAAPCGPGNAKDAERTTPTRKPKPKAKLSAVGDEKEDKGVDEEDDVAAACAPCVPRAPLRLTPPGYRGREVAVTAVVLGAAGAAVASLTVGEKISVGQMLERWRAAHPVFAGPARLYHITGTRTSTDLALREIPVSTLVRDASIEGRVVAFVLSENENDEENSVTEGRLGQYLFASNATMRMRSAAARVRMQIQIKTETNTPPETESNALAALPQLVAMEFLAPSSTAPVNDVWPFRQPPPLDAFVTSNTRAKPFGAGGTAGPRAGVVVVVFVADTLLRAPLAPFYMALASEWPAGRVLDRALRCVEEAAAAVRPVHWRLFDLMTQQPVEGQSHALRDGDGLFLGEVFPAELRAEMERLQQLVGRPAAAFALKRMKVCVTM